MNNELQEFERKLSQLINYHGLERASNTPDFILASYLVSCLNAWNEASQSKDWYYRKQ